MTSHYRHLRSFDPAASFPLQVQPGEIIVNTANRQIAVGDADAANVGVPKPLIAVRFFDATAQYMSGDIVVQGGNLYRANSSIPPGGFNAANWTQVGAVGAGSITFTPVGNVAATDVQAAIAEVDSEYRTADAAIVTAYQAADAALQTNINGKVAKGGDTMSGLLTLSGDPTAPLHAVTKQYLDANTGSLTVSDTPPAGAKDGSLWWESDSGLLYVRYNDGNTVQWVIAAPQPDINAFALANTVVRYDTAQSLSAPQQQQARQNINAADPLPGYLFGLTLSTAGSSFVFHIIPGVATDSTGLNAMKLAAAMDKSTTAWIAGSGQGALDTGTIAVNTWYHVHLIKRVDTGAVDVLVSLSPTAPTLPANYTLFRRIGSMKTNASAQWTGFVQEGDEFLWLAVTGWEITNAALTGNVWQVIPVTVPTGIKARAIFVGGLTQAGYICFKSPDQTGTASGFYPQLMYGSTQVDAQLELRTNTSAQIQAWAGAALSAGFYLTTLGWIDRRGRDA